MELRPKVVLEIGTVRGSILFLFTRVASSDTMLISIDLPSSMFGADGIPHGKYLSTNPSPRENRKIFLIKADFHDLETFNKVKKILGDKLIDFLLIDDGHTYEGVKRDFEMYSPPVRKGGIIALYDIAPGPPERQSFWRMLKVNIGI